MPTVSYKNGSIRSNSDPNNQVAVDEVQVTQTGASTATWIVWTHDPPPRGYYTVGEAVTYNAKGTLNTNADNSLVVTVQNGPCKYTCSGGWPMRI